MARWLDGLKPSNMDKLTKLEYIKATRKYALDIYKDKNKGEWFSNEFFSNMDIDITDMKAHSYVIHPTSIDKYVVDSLAMTLSMTYNAEGDPSTGNEAKRSDFVQPFLSYVISYYNRQHNIKYPNKPRLEREFVVENDLATGSIEYVIVKKNYILIIVEVKKNDWDLGRAQNMLELYVAHSNNIENGYGSHTVYGGVSIGDEWELYSYGEKDSNGNPCWNYHGKYVPLVVEDISDIIVFNVDKIKNMAETIHTMLTKSLLSSLPVK